MTINKNNFKQACENINFDLDCAQGGEYGLHDGFFNFLTKVEGKVFYVQACASDEFLDINDCGHDEGICADINEDLAEILSDDIAEGFRLIKELIATAIKELIATAAPADDFSF